ncbi:MAG: OmpA family protein [Myxococcaceae bacterium]|nr:OmpA family protein [Myxococcaceae bacterium]
MKPWLFIVVLGTLTACTEGVAPVKVDWNETVKAASAKALELTNRSQALSTQAQVLPVLEDAASPAGVQQRKWLEDMTDAEEEISDIEDAIENAEAKVKKTIAEGTMKELRTVVAHEKQRLLEEQAQAVAAVDGVTSRFEAMRGAVLAQDAAEREAAQKMPAWLRAFQRVARDGGTVMVQGLAFMKGKPELDLKSVENRKALDALTAVFTACPALKVKLTGHSAVENDAKTTEKLSLGRADAVKKYLTGHGVKKEALKTFGAADPKPFEKTSKETREKNRRLTFEVTARCL